MTERGDAELPDLAVLGGGVMGETILASALRGGWRADRVVVTERRQARAAELRERHGVTVIETEGCNAEAAARSGILVLAVKPQDAAAVLQEIAPALATGTTVVSVAVGLPTSFYESRLPAGTPVVRVMPNTPAVLGHGASAISPGAHATETQLALAEAVLAATGLVVRVPEKHQDAVAALSGSGPAYVFYVVDALAEAGVLLGLPRDLASQLATQTVLGSARMLIETGDHPAVLRERVSSPGGTTVAALRELDAHGVRAAFLAAAETARDRSQQLAAELDHP